jgi:hypothetical protein
VNVEDELIEDRLDLFHDKMILVHRRRRSTAYWLENLGVDGVTEDGAKIEETQDEDERIFSSCAH